VPVEDAAPRCPVECETYSSGASDYSYLCALATLRETLFAFIMITTQRAFMDVTNFPKVEKQAMGDDKLYAI